MRRSSKFSNFMEKGSETECQKWQYANRVKYRAYKAKHFPLSTLNCIRGRFVMGFIVKVSFFRFHYCAKTLTISLFSSMSLVVMLSRTSGSLKILWGGKGLPEDSEWFDKLSLRHSLPHFGTGYNHPYKSFHDGYDYFGIFISVFINASIQNIDRAGWGQKISLVNWYYRISLSFIHSKWRADWSVGLNAICVNMPSMSARTAIGFLQKRVRTPSRFLSRSVPVIKLMFSDCPRSLKVAFGTRSTLSGLLEFSIEWFEKHQIRSGGGSCISTGFT